VRAGKNRFFLLKTKITPNYKLILFFRRQSSESGIFKKDRDISERNNRGKRKQ